MHSASHLCSQEIEDYRKYLSLLHGLELSLWALGLYGIPQGVHSKCCSAAPLMAVSSLCGPRIRWCVWRRGLGEGLWLWTLA